MVILSSKVKCVNDLCLIEPLIQLGSLGNHLVINILRMFCLDKEVPSLS